MAEFEMPIEESIRALTRRFGAVETKLESIDSKLETIDSRLDSMDSRFDSMDARLDAMDSRFDAMDSRLDSVDTKLESISVSLDDTRQIAKLGLEAVEGLRESSDKKLTDIRRDHEKQTDLLKSVLVHVRKRVDRLERPKRRS